MNHKWESKIKAKKRKKQEIQDKTESSEQNEHKEFLNLDEKLSMTKSKEKNQTKSEKQTKIIEKELKKGPNENERCYEKIAKKKFEAAIHDKKQMLRRL